MDDKLILRVFDVVTRMGGNIIVSVEVKSGKCNVGDVLVLERTGKELVVEAIEEQSFGLTLAVSGVDFGDMERKDKIYKKGEEPEGFRENSSSEIACYYCGTRDFSKGQPGDVRDGIHKDIEGMACRRCENTITITNRYLSSLTTADSDEEVVNILNNTIKHLQSVIEDIKQGKY